MEIDSVANRCTLKVLRILSNGTSKYSLMFKETKVSDDTLQKVLKFLVKEGYVEKTALDKLNTKYDITDRGIKLLKGMEGLEKI